MSDPVEKKYFHMSLDIEGALLNWSDAKFEGMLLTPDGSPMTAREVKVKLLEIHRKGVILVPVGDCDNFDPERGCMGHIQKGKSNERHCPSETLPD